MSEATTVSQKPEPSLFLPVCLAVLALLILVVFQSSQLLREQQSLQSTWDDQVTAHADATKLRAQFEAVASGAAKLADEGNQNASAIVGALNKAGVTINKENDSSQ